MISPKRKKEKKKLMKPNLSVDEFI